VTGPVRGDALAATAAGAVVVTAAHQSPTGVVLAPERRHALLAWARERDTVLMVMSGEGRVEYEDASVNRHSYEVGDHIYVPAGVPHRIVTYGGAPHSFFDRRYAEYADASADAWTRMLNFINTPVYYVYGLAIMLSIDARLTVAALAVYPLALLVVKRTSGMLMERTLRVQEGLAELSRRSRKRSARGSTSSGWSSEKGVVPTSSSGVYPITFSELGLTNRTRPSSSSSATRSCVVSESTR